jgi:putative PIN family toxin of toxin-antitoxin system
MPSRPRVVIDTSVYISAILTPGGTASRTVEFAMARFLVVSSGDAMLELEEKLTSGKFKTVLSSADIEAFLESLVQGVEFFVPTVVRARSRDPKDDKFLDLAETVGAAYLITGDKDLFALADSHGVPGLSIVQPAEFLRQAAA